MPKKITDIALAKVPSFANRVSLFQSKFFASKAAKPSGKSPDMRPVP